MCRLQVERQARLLGLTHQFLRPVFDARRVAVFGGHAAANVPAPAVAFADHLVEQLFPASGWGSEFVTVPLAWMVGEPRAEQLQPEIRNDRHAPERTSPGPRPTPVAQLDAEPSE